MLVSLLISLTVVPALLTFWPLRLDTREPDETGDWLTRVLFHLSPRRRRLTHGLTLIAVIGSLFVLPRVRFDYNPFNLRDPGSESIRTFNDLTAAGTITPWTIVVLAQDAKTARKMAERIGKLSSVDKVVTVDSFVPPQQDQKMAMIGDLRLVLGSEALDPPETPLPPSAEQIAALNDLERKLQHRPAPGGKEEANQAFARLARNLQLLLASLKAADPGRQQDLLARLQKSLLGLLPATLNNLDTVLNATPFGLGDLPRDLHDRWQSGGGIFRIEVLPKGDMNQENAIRRFIAQVRSVVPDAAGDAINILESGDAVVRSFQHAFIGALIAIVLILLAAMRNFKDSLLVLLPLVITGMLTGAATVLLHVPFNFASVIALPLLLGTGIECGIQVVQRMQRNVPLSGEIPRSSTAKGIIYSTLTTIFSFGNLALMGHRGIASMGQLLTLGVIFSLLINLLILPAFLKEKPTPSFIDADFRAEGGKDNFAVEAHHH
jgi:hopanoid biosynthesis associated RND transporter like protein HpnN